MFVNCGKSQNITSNHLKLQQIVHLFRLNFAENPKSCLVTFKDSIYSIQNFQEISIKVITLSKFATTSSNDERTS